MNRRTGKRKGVCLILLATIFLTLLFIFGNSLATEENSKQLSDKVNETVGEVITVVVGEENSAAENLFTKYHRKIAHFLEFAFLGMQIALLLHFSDRRHFSDLVSGALLAFAIASIDESIQMLSGRGDQVSDILIDVAGYLSAYLIVLAILFLAFWRSNKKTAKKPKKEHVQLKNAIERSNS